MNNTNKHVPGFTLQTFETMSAEEIKIVSEGFATSIGITPAIGGVDALMRRDDSIPKIGDFPVIEPPSDEQAKLSLTGVAFIQVGLKRTWFGLSCDPLPSDFLN